MNDIYKLIVAGELSNAANWINFLDDADRVTLRSRLEAEGLPAPRNLYFNYETQTWID